MAASSGLTKKVLEIPINLTSSDDVAVAVERVQKMRNDSSNDILTNKFKDAVEIHETRTSIKHIYQKLSIHCYRSEAPGEVATQSSRTKLKF